MYSGYTESAEKIAARKARICAGAAIGRGTVATESAADARSRSLVGNLFELIEQARGELNIRKLYERQGQS